MAAALPDFVITARHWLAALSVFAGAFTLYAATGAPGLLFGDSAEFAAAAITGGIPHATGYPTFCMVGNLFARLGGDDPARAINLMSGFFGALSLGLLVLVMGEMGVGAGAAAVAALAFGLTFTHWRTSLRAEVYGLAIVTALVALWAVLRARRTGGFGSVLLAGYLLGLTLTGHLAFAPAVAFAGLALAWQVARTGRQVVPRLVLLLLAFAIGLTPYLYLVWADVRGAEINYYDLVRLVKNPDGGPMPGFETPWERLAWMLTGRNQYPVVPVPTDLKAGVVNLIEAGFILFVFELGPVALVLALLGLARQWGADRVRTGLIVLAVVISVLFAAYVQARAMLHIFLIPAMVLIALAVGAGVDEALARLRLAGARAAFAFVPLAAAMIVPGPFIRDYAARHPLTKWEFHVEEEDPTLEASFLPSMRGFDPAERYRREVVPRVPDSALVLAGWSELNVFRYEQAVHGRRRDLTLQQITIETLPRRLEVWQRTHDLARRPFVFTELPPGLPPAPRDTIALGAGRFLYVQRVPGAGPTP